MDSGKRLTVYTRQALGLGASAKHGWQRDRLPMHTVDLTPRQMRRMVHKMRRAARLACVHPGVFATDAPTTFCCTCGNYVPRASL